MSKRETSIAVGATAAAAGFGLAVASRRRKPRDVTDYRARASRTVTIAGDAKNAHALWHQHFTEFFRGVTAVEPMEDGRQRWTIDGTKKGRSVEVTVVDDRPGERIEWQAKKIGGYPAHGLVTFTDAGVRGCEVRLALAFDGSLAKTNAAIARVFGFAPAQIAAESLRAFKALAETGEIPKAVRS